MVYCLLFDKVKFKISYEINNISKVIRAHCGTDRSFSYVINTMLKHSKTDIQMSAIYVISLALSRDNILFSLLILPCSTFYNNRLMISG